MTIAKQFLHSLQRATDTKEFPKLSEPVLPEKTGQLTFQMVLDEYAKYYNSLKSTAKKEKLSRIFWQQIKALGTPIIEDIPGNDSECSVYFLYPKENLERRAKRGGKKDLYLQGDFHGYGSVDGRQQLLELEKTGIMTRRDSIPKKSILTYSYTQETSKY